MSEQLTPFPSFFKPVLKCCFTQAAHLAYLIYTWNPPPPHTWPEASYSPLLSFPQHLSSNPFLLLYN